MKRYISAILLLLGISLVALAEGASSPLIGAWIINSNNSGGLATTTGIKEVQNTWPVQIGTSSPFFTSSNPSHESGGLNLLSIYGTTTIQTPINSLSAFRVLNAASSSIFAVDTINASTTIAGVLNVQSCNGCSSGITSLNGLTGATQTFSVTMPPLLNGRYSTLTISSSGTTHNFILEASSSPTYGFVNATSTATSTIASGLSVGNTLSASGVIATSSFTLGSNGLFTSLLGTGLTNSASVLTVSSVPNSALQNSTIGLSSSGSLTITGSPASLGGSLTANLNLGNANTWTALQTFNGGLIANLATSTQATTTDFYVSSINNKATSTTLVGGVNIGVLNATSTTATSTFANGTQLSGGCYKGTTGGCITSEDDKSFTFASSTLAYSGAYGANGTTTLNIADFKHPTTLVTFYCKTNRGTAWVNFGTGTATSTTASGSTQTSACSTSGVEVNPTLNNTWNARQDFLIGIGTITGTPDFITVTATIREN